MREAMMEELVKEVQEIAGEEYELTASEKRKNNGTVYTAVEVYKKGSPLAFCVYVDAFMNLIERKEATVREVAEEIYAIASQKMPAPVNDLAKNLKNPDYVLQHVECEVVNYNSNAALLEKVPHEIDMDLAVIYRVFGEKGEDQASILISNELLGYLNIGADELRRAAWENTEKNGFVISSMVKELSNLGVTVEDNEMIDFVIHKNGGFGATALLYPKIFEPLAEKAGGDLYIVPSSIYELIALPKFMSVEEVRATVLRVNREVVDEELYLSDKVYLYKKESGEIVIA